MKIQEQKVELIWITSHPEKTIERIGRTCYKSEDKITNDSHEKFIDNLLNLNHDAMIEHAVASFRIITNRSISHEIVRHRLASFAQESTRFCNYTKDKFGGECTFIEPPELFGTQRAEWLKACRASEKSYLKMIKEGYKPQIARSVLLTCLKTEIVMTTNFREWLHFIKLRSSNKAHPQIKEIAIKIKKILNSYAPIIFKV